MVFYFSVCFPLESLQCVHKFVMSSRYMQEKLVIFHFISETKIMRNKVDKCMSMCIYIYVLQLNEN